MDLSSSPRKPDYPIARGVSPPPRPFRRTGATRQPETVIEAKLVVPPWLRRKPRGSGPMIALQVVAVFGLAAASTAIGWWAFQGRGATKAPAAPEVAKVDTAKFIQPPAVNKPIEKPIAPPAAQTKKSPPKPQPPAIVVEKPADRPVDLPPPPHSEKPPAKSTTSLTFAKDVQPIFRAKCVNCHGDRKLKGGLDVRTLRSLEKGGDTGPAINRSEPELSLLWDAIANGSMPPGKSNKVTAAEKKKIHDWLVGGGT
jgi:hypothetical protein